MSLVGLCRLDTGSEGDMEAVIDPLLCPYQPSASLVSRGNQYTELPESYSGQSCTITSTPHLCSCSPCNVSSPSDQRLVCRDSYSDYRTRDFFTCRSDCVDHVMQLSSAGVHLQTDQFCVDDCERGSCSGSYMGQ